MCDTGAIFHEKQEGRLCAQHCLNAVLQGPYFTAVDLGEIALRLDEEERQQMAENGVESEDYRQFIQQPSGNMDDTGFFSVQVISRALTLWNLEMIPLHSSDEYAKQCRENLAQVRAYILNMESHWFCLRRFGHETNTTSVWFNLNSLLAKPQYMSCTYLIEYLKQMEKEGYSIFVVKGEFPACAAEKNSPVFRPVNPCATVSDSSVRDLIDLTKSKSCVSLGENEEDMQKAIELSLQCSKPSTSFNDNPTMHNGSDEKIDADLESALRLSLECFSTQELDCDRQIAETLNTNRIRDKRLAYYESLSSSQQK